MGQKTSYMVPTYKYTYYKCRTKASNQHECEGRYSELVTRLVTRVYAVGTVIAPQGAPPYVPTIVA